MSKQKKLKNWGTIEKLIWVYQTIEKFIDEKPIDFNKSSILSQLIDRGQIKPRLRIVVQSIF